MPETPEDKARKNIDLMLTQAGWSVQDFTEFDPSKSLGIAVRRFRMKEGEADYLLFVGRKAVGVLEAKKEGRTLGGASQQSEFYLRSLPENIPNAGNPLPFSYQSTGVETTFRDLRDPDSRTRPIFSFHRPETLQEWLGQGDSLRFRLRNALPPLETPGLRTCQYQAITHLEQSFGQAKPRALIQMASGSGKTYTAVSFSYRLIKFAKAKRILFLVDRRTLGRQTFREFQQFITPDDGRKFTELYNVQHMTSNKIDPVSKVCITTIQRLYSMLSGEEEFNDEIEDVSMFELNPNLQTQKKKEVHYNARIPIETFDFIITDECHRSIYNLWSQVLEYFDSFIIGLTATPSLQTLGFFNQNLVMEYNQTKAIADGVNVQYQVYRIQTDITQHGATAKAGWFVKKRDRMKRKEWEEQLDEDLQYAPNELDRSVVANDQIRTIIKTFKERLFTDIFPGRKEIPKTLVFAKDDSHAEDIVSIIREEFGKGDAFCKKITYTTYRTGEDPEDLIRSFCNSYDPRIAVTVDMISTGTDIRPLECLLFMRDVRSQLFFEQMKGRGSRVISSTEFEAVTPDAKNKEQYIIVDAVGVCESEKTETRPLERKRGLSFDKLLMSVALGSARDEDSISSLAARLAMLSRELDEKDRQEIASASNGKPLTEIIGRLLDAVDDAHIEDKAKELFHVDEPNKEQMDQAERKMIDDACSIFDSPKLRNTLIELRQRNEQTIDYVSPDKLLFAGYDEKARERAQEVVKNFKKFIDEHRDELLAYQIIYNKPYSKRRITYEDVKTIANQIAKPPYNLTPELLWKAYEQLDRSRVRGSPPQKLLTNIVSLIRFAVGEYETLEPFSDTVNKRFEDWLEMQVKNGIKFTDEQVQWLTMIKDQLAASLSADIEDFEYAPFYEKGGPSKFYQIFGAAAKRTLEELTEAIAK